MCTIYINDINMICNEVVVECTRLLYDAETGIHRVVADPDMLEIDLSGDDNVTGDD